MAEKPNQSLGEQAARFSLYTPLVVVLVGFFAHANKDSTGVASALFVVNVLLLISGFALGITALVSMRRYGRPRILVRASIGTIANGLVIAALLSLVLPLMMAARAKTKLTGKWIAQSVPVQPGDKMTIDLAKDGGFTFDTTRDGAPYVTLNGTWEFNRARVLSIHIDHVATGSSTAVGKTLGLGTVTSVNEIEMILNTDHGPETYRRAAP